MVQMWLLRWPKTTATTSTAATSASQSDSTYCCMSKKPLSKVLKTLKKHGSKMLHRHLNITNVSRTRPCCSFQYHYDPLSYSLNFDTSGSGSLLDDEDYYYKFYSFSSRFVATSKSPSTCPTSQA